MIDISVEEGITCLLAHCHPIKQVEERPLSSVDGQILAEAILSPGEETQKGTCLLKAGEKLNAIKLGLLANVGMASVKIRKPLKMALICAGGELIPVWHATL